MKKYILFSTILYCMLYCQTEQKTVFLPILARNKAHVLPLFLHCIENLIYEKKLITIYVNTNDNSDDTEKILDQWVTINREKYCKIIYEKHNTNHNTTNPHEWNKERFAVLSKIRNRSLQIAIEEKNNFYFVVDCDNFIEPETLKVLVHEDKPIIAPMLVSIPEKNDRYSNFFCDIDSNGYYKHNFRYDAILDRNFIGTFAVPVVHCTYLIKQEYLPLLSYQDGTGDYEFVIFSRVARQNKIPQYICNKKFFGTVVHFYKNVTLDEEKFLLQYLTLR